MKHVRNVVNAVRTAVVTIWLSTPMEDRIVSLAVTTYILIALIVGLSHLI